jgi:hypothetical protein
MSFDLCLIDLRSFNDLERNLVHCQTSFHIDLGGIGFISIVTMAHCHILNELGFSCFIFGL